ncbi:MULTISPECIES: PGPGW domain-containing protein [Rothia]|nr:MULTISPECIES: PGPGW domain-containing protein [Rothia]
MHAHPVMRHLYKPLVIGVGAFCFIAGLIMLVTPGPGWLFIFIGLGIWGTEFTWARRANVFMKHVVLTAWYRYRAWRQQRKERKAARKAERKAVAANQR